jgi:hypothetical protein
MRRFLPLLLLLLIASCAPLPGDEVSDLVITDRQIWQGEVRVNGRVRVTREGSLTLRPGTRILFSRFDKDADGIGDAELFVEGEFVARGTADQPILLTSAAATPQPGDWKFLYFDYARKVEIEYMISEYAYSGVQVHFCRAQIDFSEFRYNVDGVRFSTANISLKDSYLHHNRHGIRYEERGGRGVVQQNRISDNQIGIFAVTRGEGRTLFERNDIIDNNPYQVKMGLQQTTALDFPRNWWGDVGGVAAETVFDQQRDRSLGRVTGTEPLDRPISASR